MDENAVLLLFVTLYITIGCCQEIDTNITLETNLKSIISNVGESHILNCSANAKKDIFFSNPIVWTHEATDGRRTVISRYMGETDITDRYHVTDKSTALIGTLELNITDVQMSDDGTFVCSIKNTLTNDLLDIVHVDFVVLNPAKMMSVVIKNEHFETIVYKTDTILSTSIPEGKYFMTCAMNGSNPEPDVQISLGDKFLISNKNVIENNNSNSLTRSYYAEMTSTLYLSERDSGKDLQCVSSLPNLPKLDWIKLNITVLPSAASSSVTFGRVIPQQIFLIFSVYLFSSSCS